MSKKSPFELTISADQLHELGEQVVVFDCSFDLSNPEWGVAQFNNRHIAGAQYAHLDVDLSEKRPGHATRSGGRHPLPTPEAFAQWLAQRGVGADTQVVSYDRNNHMFCVRLWWMCQWVGHQACAVLDGGLAAWGERPTHAGPGVVASPVSRQKPGIAIKEYDLVAINTVANGLRLGQQTIVDARAAPRFRGDVEPLDPVAGHIPGALNRPFADNFGADGRFKSADTLRREWLHLLGGRDPATVVHHCGSGVSATPNVLSMALAGWSHTPLFGGSWSEWSNTPGLPVARG